MAVSDIQKEETAREVIARCETGDLRDTLTLLRYIEEAIHKTCWHVQRTLEFTEGDNGRK